MVRARAMRMMDKNLNTPGSYTYACVDIQQTEMRERGLILLLFSSLLYVHTYLPTYILTGNFSSNCGIALAITSAIASVPTNAACCMYVYVCMYIYVCRLMMMASL